MFRVLKNIFRKKKTALAENTEFTEYKAAEAGFSVFREGEGAVFRLGKEEKALFKVAELILNKPEFSQRERAGVPVFVYKFSSDFVVTCIPSQNNIDFAQDLHIQKAEIIKGYGGRQGLDIKADFGSGQMRYLIEVDEGCPIIDFCETSSHELKSIDVPSVEEMTASVSAILKQDRTVSGCLYGLLRRSDNKRVLDIIEFIKEHFGAHEELLNSDTSEVTKLLEDKGLVINVNILTATCLLADIFLEKLTKSTLKDSLERQQTVKISPLGFRVAAAFFTDNEEELQEDQLKEAYHFLADTIKERTFRSTVCDIVEDGGNEETAVVLKKLLEFVPENEEFNFKQCALCSLFGAYGKQTAPGTISAFCLYADLKAKLIDEELIEQFLPETYLSEHSLYAMLAVGRAFGLNLTSLTITGTKCEDALHDFSKLLSLTDKGALASFLDAQDGSTKVLYVKDSKDLQELCAENYSFTGCIIIGLPVIEKVSTLDMASFLQKGLPLLACFADEKNSLRWSVFSGRQVGEAPFSVAGRHGFIDGYQVYRFHNRIVGRIIKCGAEKLVGRTNVAAAYVDEKGNRSYRFITKVDSVDSLMAPSGSGLTFGEEIAEFPRFKGLLGYVYESSKETLAGLTPVEAEDSKRLARCFASAQSVLTEKIALVSVAKNSVVLNILRQILGSEEFMSALDGAISRFACWRFSALLGPKDSELLADLQLSPKLIDALQMPDLSQVVVMIIMHSVFSKSGAIFNSQQMLWNPSRLRNKIQELLFTVANNSPDTVGSIACRLLANPIFAHTKDSYAQSVAKLQTLLNNTHLESAAAEALARLALTLSAHLPTEVDCEGWERVDVVDALEAEAAEQAAESVRRWLDDPNKDSEAKTLEAPALANMRSEEPKIKLLGRYMVKVDGAFQKESVTVSKPYLILLPNLANTQRQKLVAAWHSFLTARNLPLSSQEYGMNIFDNFCEYLPGYEDASHNEVAVREFDIFELAGGRRLKPGTDPFFIKLASLIPPPTRADEFEVASLPLICRCPYGTKESDAVDLGACEVFNAESGEWVPFMDFRFCMALHLDDENRILYETLGNIYSKVMESKRAKAASEATCVATAGMISAGSRESISTDQKRKVCLTLEDLAANLANSLSLGGEEAQKAVIILLGLRKSSLYKLPSYLEGR